MSGEKSSLVFAKEQVPALSTEQKEKTASGLSAYFKKDQDSSNQQEKKQASGLGASLGAQASPVSSSLTPQVTSENSLSSSSANSSVTPVGSPPKFSEKVASNSKEIVGFSNDKKENDTSNDNSKATSLAIDIRGGGQSNAGEGHSQNMSQSVPMSQSYYFRSTTPGSKGGHDRLIESQKWRTMLFAEKVEESKSLK